MRNISLFFTRDQREVSIESDATTLGELKRDSALSSENFSGVKLTIKETRNTLETSDSTLPEGDFTLYVYPAKSKAGMTYDDERELLSIVREVRAGVLQLLENQKSQSQSQSQPESGGIQQVVDPKAARLAELKADADRLQREMSGSSTPYASNGYEQEEEEEEEEEDENDLP